MRALVAAALRQAAERLAPSPPLSLRIECEGEAIVRAIKLRNRRKGLGSAGI